jgi:dTDP-4-amino-4,6-dideoxygalactose transaminase
VRFKKKKKSDGIREEAYKKGMLIENMASIKPFHDKIYVSRPLLPDLNEMNGKLREIWDSEWLTNMGKQHKLFENKLTEYLKVPSLSLFNNGTIALIVACQSLRLSGEVITTPFTFAATPHVLSWNNISPIFCDIDLETMNIDADKIESLITPKTTGILAVHVFGTPCDVLKIQEVAERYGLRIIYDAAHAFNVEIDDIGIGCFGDISMFSFHATKLFHTAEGGALSFRDKALKNRIDLLKNFGIKNEDEVVMPGINGKMNEIQAALGLIMLDYVEEERIKRKTIMDIYVSCLKDIEGVSFLKERENVRSSYQYFPIRIDEKIFGRSRDYVYNKFKEYNIYTRKYFFPLCSDYPCYKQIPSAHPSNLPVSQRVVKDVLSLPFYGRLSIDDATRICAILKSFKN